MDFLLLDGDLKTQSLEKLKISTSKVKNDFSLVALSGVTTTHVAADNMMHAVGVEPPSTAKLLDDGYAASAELSEFLKRDVKIQEATWTHLQRFDFALNPWNSFFSIDSVARKMQNYSLVKGNLVVTIMVNGTPFHHGALVMSYRYLNRENIQPTFQTDFLKLVTYSQRPNVFINVSTGQSACLCIPYVAPTNYFNLVEPELPAPLMGRIEVNSVDLLQMVSGTENITVSFLAHMTDVVLAAPVPNLSAFSQLPVFDFDIEAQSDEYSEDGPISGPASTVANIAGALTEAPVIGPLAVATQMGANSIAHFARFFGYSKPVNIEDRTIVKNIPVRSLALTEGDDTSSKLTVTAKQELSIDPVLEGLLSEDQLALSFFTQRETILDRFEWFPSTPQDDFIYKIKVTPIAEHRLVELGNELVIPTSLSMVSRLFEAWSGSIIYRFRIIASQYHRGRLQFVHTPTGVLSESNLYNTAYNCIADISECRDISIVVHYRQGIGYSLCDFTNNLSFTSTNPVGTDLIPDQFYDNGILGVRVLNQLTVPGSDRVQVVVSIKAGPDFELMNPTGEGIFNSSIFTPDAVSGPITFDFDLEAQAADVEITPKNEFGKDDYRIVHLGECTATPEHKPLLYYGERVLSLRQLLKRYNFMRRVYQSSSSDNQTERTYLFLASPGMRGNDNFGPDDKLTGGKYNFCSTTLLSYLRNSFAGWKGSIRYKVLPNRTLIGATIMRRESDAGRDSGASNNYRSFKSRTFTKNVTNASQAAKAGADLIAGTPAGASRAQFRTLDVLEFEIPYATPVRFSTTDLFNTASSNIRSHGYPGGNRVDVSMMSDVDEFNFDIYVAAGEDFQYLAYLGAAPFWNYNNPTPI